MQRKDSKTNRLDRKPSRRHLRQIRQSGKYSDIRGCLGTNDRTTVLLCRLSDIHHVEAGQALNGPAWTRAHVVIGLSAGLRLQTTVYVSDTEQAAGQLDISAPWIVRNLDHGRGRLSVNQPGLVLTIDRRHLHLIEPGLLGRVEPIDPIAQAFREVKPTAPVAEPATQS